MQRSNQANPSEPAARLSARRRSWLWGAALTLWITVVFSLLFGVGLFFVLPLLAIPYFYQRYHLRYITATLPGVLGITAPEASASGGKA